MRIWPIAALSSAALRPLQEKMRSSNTCVCVHIVVSFDVRHCTDACGPPGRSSDARRGKLCHARHRLSVAVSTSALHMIRGCRAECMRPESQGPLGCAAPTLRTARLCCRRMQLQGPPASPKRIRTPSAAASCSLPCWRAPPAEAKTGCRTDRAGRCGRAAAAAEAAGPASAGRSSAQHRSADGALLCAWATAFTQRPRERQQFYDNSEELIASHNIRRKTHLIDHVSWQLQFVDLAELRERQRAARHAIVLRVHSVLSRGLIACRDLLYATCWRCADQRPSRHSQPQAGGGVLIPSRPSC